MVMTEELYNTRNFVEEEKLETLFFDVLMFSLIPLRSIVTDVVFNIILTLYIFFGIAKIIFRKRLYINKFIIIFMLFIVYSSFSFFYSTNINGPFYAFIRLIPNSLFGFVLIQNIYFSTKIQSRRIQIGMNLIKYYTWSTIFSCLYIGIFEFSSIISGSKFGSIVFKDEGLTSFSYNLILAITYIVYSLLVIKKSKFLNFTNILFLLLLLGAAALTSIRKSLFAPLLFSGILIIIMYRKNFKKLVKSLLVFIIIGAIVIFTVLNVPSLYLSVGRRFITLLNSIINQNAQIGYYVDYSVIERALLRENAMEIFKTHPIFGVGLDTFKYYTVRMGTAQIYAHNNYLELLASTGIVGFLLFYSSIMNIFTKTVKNYINTNDLTYAFIISFIITQLFLDFGTVTYYTVYHIPLLFLFSIYTNKDKIR